MDGVGQEEHGVQRAAWQRLTLRFLARIRGVSPALQPGRALGGRCEILQLLGEDGMGAANKAQDHELDWLVALKVISPELAGHSEILKHLKQELLLARQVIHRNVIPIFALREAEGLKFISMQYTEGRDLKSILNERKLTTVW